MCTYGIGLPFDHPIWQNLPPCPHYPSHMSYPYPVWMTTWRPAKPIKGKRKKVKR